MQASLPLLHRFAFLSASSLALLTSCPETYSPQPQDFTLTFEPATYTYTAKVSERRDVTVPIKNSNLAEVQYAVILPDDAFYEQNDTVFFDIDPDALSGTAASGQSNLKLAMQCPVVPGSYTNTVEVSYTANGTSKRSTLTVTAVCEAAPIPTVVNENTRVLTPATTDLLTQFDPETGVLTFTGNSPQLDELAVDQVLVAPPVNAAQEGLMVIARSISRTGNVTTVQTEPAGLMNVFDSADINISFETPPSDDIAEDPGLPPPTIPGDPPSMTGQTLRVQALSASLSKTLYDIDGNAATTDDQVRVHGKFSLGPKHEFTHKFAVHYRTKRIFGAKIKIPVGFSLQARIGAGVAQSLNLRVYSTGGLAFKAEPFEKNLYRKTGTPIVIPVGPVPLTFVPQYTIDARADFDAAARFDVGFTQGMQFIAGVKFNNGSLGTYFDQSSSFTRQLNVLNGSVNASVTLSGGVTFSLYGAVGPYVGVGFGPKFVAKTTEGPPPAINWDLSGCVNGQAGIKKGIALQVRIFGYKIPVPIPERNWNLISQCNSWAKGSIPIKINQTPQVDNIFGYFTEPIPTSCSLRLMAFARDPDGDELTYSWLPGPESHGVNKDTRYAYANFSGGTFAPGLQRITLTVRDSKGAVTTRTRDLNFVQSETCGE